MALRVDFSRLDRKLAKIAKEIEPIASEALKETAEQAVKTIVGRTRRKSLDAEGRQFKAYSESYKKQKQKRGASSRVNLTSPGATVSGGGRLRGNAQGGTMLDSITIIRVEDNRTRYVVGAARRIEQEKLQRHVRGEGVPVRNPIGFTNKEEEALAGRAQRQILAKIRNIGTS